MKIASVLFFLCLLTGNVFAENSKLKNIFDQDWKWRMKDDPLFATSTGNHEYDALLPQVTKQDYDRRADHWRKTLDQLKSIDRSTLTTSEQVSYDLFREDLQDNLSEYEFHTYLIPLNADSGFYSDFARLPREIPLFTVKDYENYIARMNAFPAYVNQNIELMHEGLKTGMSIPRVVLNGIDTSISMYIVEDPARSVFYPPFQTFPNGVPESDRKRLHDAGVEAIRKSIVPAYQTLLDFMTKTYIPKTRQTLGASELPNGQKYYEYLVRHFTTLDMTPAQVHQIGLDEVARIHKEMDAIIQQVGFHGDFASFLKFLRTDPRFYAKTAEELLKDASYIAKRIDGKLPSLFNKLPRLPYTVEPVPDSIAPKYTGGRYVEPPQGSTEPGIYWVNTYALESRPLYTLESLTLHEAVPGHHLQIALAREMENLPEFRKSKYISAFGEGWGLYSEWLGVEAGFYKDPYSNFGRLTYEMWRACRLVVDTGIHSMDWTRQQALDYLGSNTALSLHEVETETDRYISVPGQALSYKIGELKIKELRKKAETALGPKFNVREFHDAVLENGSLTLPVLERMIDAYIASKK